MKSNSFVLVFTGLLLLLVLMSFYMFVMTVFMKSNTYATVHSNWQFPMLFALFFDVYLL